MARSSAWRRRLSAVTNIDREHLDHYGTMERLNDSFLEFINKVPFYGLAVLCADDERLRELLPRVVKRYQTYGLQEHAGHVPDFRATDISLRQWGSEFRAHFPRARISDRSGWPSRAFTMCRTR